MKEIKSLINKSQRFLRTAELLIGENDYDSSISRSYYAMFYSV